MISKSGQPSDKPVCSTAIGLSLSHRPAMAFKVDFADYEAEGVQHQHPQDQLILALHGAVTCTAESGGLGRSTRLWTLGTRRRSSQQSGHAQCSSNIPVRRARRGEASS